MLARHAISDWARVEPLLPKHGPAKTKRRFLDAVLFVARTGIPWRDLPERFGHWNGVWKRFDRWYKDRNLVERFWSKANSTDGWPPGTKRRHATSWPSSSWRRS